MPWQHYRVPCSPLSGQQEMCRSCATPLARPCRQGPHVISCVPISALVPCLAQSPPSPLPAGSVVYAPVHRESKSCSPTPRSEPQGPAGRSAALRAHLQYLPAGAPRPCPFTAAVMEPKCVPAVTTPCSETSAIQSTGAAQAQIKRRAPMYGQTAFRVASCQPCSRTALFML